MRDPVKIHGATRVTSVYVAGAGREIARCEEFIARLREGGYTITFDWCASRRLNPATDADLSDLEREAAAHRCVAGAATCDVFVLLVPQPGVATTGAWVEWGYAVARRDDPHLVVVGDDRRTVLTALPDVEHFVADAEALAFLCALR